MFVRYSVEYYYTLTVTYVVEVSGWEKISTKLYQPTFFVAKLFWNDVVYSLLLGIYLNIYKGTLNRV